MTAIDLYFSPQPTRSARARWAFLEAGTAFTGHTIDVFKGEQSTAAYLSVNPLGFVPTALFDGEPVTESSALALIAATETTNAAFVVKPGTSRWRQALRWSIFAPAELDHFLATLNAHRLFRAPAERDPQVTREATAAFGRRAERLGEILTRQDYLVDHTFTVADVCVGHSMAWAKMHDLLGAFPRLEAYLAKLSARPAFAEVYGPEVRVMPDPYAS